MTDPDASRVRRRLAAVPAIVVMTSALISAVLAAINNVRMLSLLLPSLIVIHRPARLVMGRSTEVA